MYKTSQDKTPVPVNHHGEASVQPIAVSSPSSVRSPLLRQRRVICSEDELSDDEDSDHIGNARLFLRATKSDSTNLSDAQSSHVSKADSDIIIATSSLDVDGDSDDGGELQICGSSDVTASPYDSFSHFEEGITNKPESPGSESPFLPIHCPSEHKAGEASSAGSGSTNLTILNENHTNQDDGQSESKRSPKLEHKAVTRVKSMMSAEAANLPQQQRAKAEETSVGLASSPSQCGRTPRMTGGLIPHQQCEKGEASELVGICTIDTVTLRRSEDESFGLNLEIMSSPLKVVITGLKPGGAAERVWFPLHSRSQSVIGYFRIRS